MATDSEFDEGSAWEEEQSDDDSEFQQSRKAKVKKAGPKKTSAKPKAKAKANKNITNLDTETEEDTDMDLEDEEFVEDDNDDDDDDSSFEKEDAKKTSTAKKAANKAKAKKESTAGSKRTDPGGVPAKSAKKAKVATLNEKDSTKLILEYMIKQNRPYSHQNVFDNLHGQVKKVMVPKILSALTAKKHLQEKVYGKAKIYLADQSQFPDVDKFELDSAEAQVKTLKERQAELNSIVSGLTQERDRLSKILSHSELQAKVEKKRLELQEKTAALEKIESNGIVIPNAADFQRVQDDLNRHLKAWKSRKAMVSEGVDAVLGDSNIKMKDMLESMGIETDEDVEVNFKEFWAYKS